MDVNSDQLSQVLSRFSVTAGVFYSGNLCGFSSFESPNEQVGHIHLLKKGRLEIQYPGGKKEILDKPSLVFYPKPIKHRIIASEADQTEVVCATVSYGAGPSNPLAQALPEMICQPLTANPRLSNTVIWLFEEAFSDQSGKQVVMNKLCEILIVQLLRQVIEKGESNGGMLAGLADPQLNKALQLIHQQPQKNWLLQDLATAAAMSRSKFAEQFKLVIGQTVGEYQTSWRLSIAKGLLKQGYSVGWVANEVGYENASALARVFRKQLGVSPKQWLLNFG
ncbi:AraC family transcriptional regulator [Pelagibaculum spongiae]|uniref:AraC family transcriptional regulator n=1 Tax=Pelagibaculum spongiae TaxID=2080658 RepID=A0A2V1H049_9GAMM|nr:AraC family transcriptional regulator [Pelagibaculum spongiae]PVZ72376.1 AraC family transcriptional regulator [Pelagibaculum spongiae]